MSQTIDAVFDGTVLRPEEPLQLQANTRVRITVVEVVPSNSTDQADSFLKTAKALRLDGPPDWSANIDQHLYGEQTQ
ncbi:antitoxin family protein [Gloeobacter morelensis]|uniref:Antitoxin family protein n=1 Tax=Gloeobacter morelensis MG652769 TaxID=2781736 RepID=A0ABY3PQN7_9CYAN|nr:antitoxin family protein [Gloeobacter morelensis MG652769]